MRYKNRLYELRGSLSQKEFAERIGLTQQNYANYENGKQGLKSDLITKICEIFGCSAEWLLELDSDKRTASDTRPVTGMAMGYVPLRCRVHAGEPVAMEILDERGDMVLCPQLLIDRYPDIWAGQSEGDCMNNVFPEGCIYFVTAAKPHRNGQPEVRTIDGADTVARRAFQTSETLLLSPDSTNPANKDIVIRADDDHYAEYDGAIVWYQSNGEVE